MPAPIELNSLIAPAASPGAYVVTEITQRMNRASTLKFFVPTALGDAAAMTARTDVVYSYVDPSIVSPVDADHQTWFVGKTLAPVRTIRNGEDGLEYTCADIFEYLGNNPCDEASEWYNRTALEVSAYPWPYDKTVREIIEAELASLVGAGTIALDFAGLGAFASLVVSDFQTKGKTFLGLIEALAHEVPVMGYWFDPSTIPYGTTAGGTLRFYDLSATGTPKTLTLPLAVAVGGASGANVESVTLQEDFSACVDTLEFYGLGSLTEIYEKATAAWTAYASGTFQRTLRDDPTEDPDTGTTTGAVQYFTPGVGGGTWTTDTVSNPGVRPWYPGISDRNLPYVGKRYSVTKEIVDLRLAAVPGSSPVQYVKQDQSMWAETLMYTWYTGPLGFTIGSAFYAGQLTNDGTKYIPYTNGIVDDYGHVRKNDDMYPASHPDQPRFPVPAPQATEKNYFLLQEPLVRRTQYAFTSNLGSANYNHLVGTDTVSAPIYMYWPTGADVWLRYTGADPLSVSAVNPALGYDKRTKLYDARFLKYTDKDGTVLRDDTGVMTSYVNMLFALMSKTRVYGEVAVHRDPLGFNAALPMAAGIVLANYNGGSYTVPARVQGRTLTKLRDRWEIRLAFDTPSAFASLDLTLRMRQFFEGNALAMAGGLHGKRGQELVVPYGGDAAKKPIAAGATAPGPLFGGSTQPPEPPAGIIMGTITAANPSTTGPVRATSAFPNYVGTSLGGKWATAQMVPLYRPYTASVRVIPAAIGSQCEISLVPNDTNTGYTAQLNWCDEKINFVTCAPGGGFLYASGDGQFSPDDVVFGKNSTPVVGTDGDVVVANTMTLASDPEDEIVTGASYLPIVGVNDNLVVRSNASLIVAYTYFDDWIVGNTDLLLMSGTYGAVEGLVTPRVDPVPAVTADSVAAAIAAAASKIMTDTAVSGTISVTYTDSEVPSGTVNGVNAAFTLAHTPTAGTVHVYKNGLRQTPGAGNDYTISGATITFEAGNLPLTGDSILADYRR